MAKKKPKLGALKKKAWDIFSKIVRQMYADHRGWVECVTCAKQDHWKFMQAGHFIPKAKGTSVYFECSNVHTQCERCNIWEKEYAKIQYYKWMAKHYGEDEIERLEALAHTERKITRVEYEQMIDFFKQCERELT